MWIQRQGINLCKAIEMICPDFGCHVALTGGLLYKGGLRKDCDLVFYRIRQCDRIDVDGLLTALNDRLDIRVTKRFGWGVKAIRPRHGDIDMFFPEQGVGGEEEYGVPNPEVSFR